jgi:hypothetical protein
MMHPDEAETALALFEPAGAGADIATDPSVIEKRPPVGWME